MAGSTSTYRCIACGAEHPGPPRAYVTGEPAGWEITRDPSSRQWGEEFEEQAILHGPEGEKGWYVRGNIVIPVEDDDQLVYTVWLSLSQNNFDRAHDLWTSPARVDEPPYFGWLSSVLPGYPFNDEPQDERLVASPRCATARRASADRPSARRRTTRRHHAGTPRGDRRSRCSRHDLSAAPSMLQVPIYLDFDGVMNSFSRDAQRLTSRTGFGRWRFIDSDHQHEGRPFPLAVSDDRNHEVRSWCESGAEIVWLTTWWEAPADVVTQTGIDAPFAAPDNPNLGSRDWKAAVVEARHAVADRFVWIDDADVPTGFGRHFPNSLVIRPSDRFGLFARDAIRVRDFLTE